MTCEDVHAFNCLSDLKLIHDNKNEAQLVISLKRFFSFSKIFLNIYPSASSLYILNAERSIVQVACSIQIYCLIDIINNWVRGVIDYS